MKTALEVVSRSTAGVNELDPYFDGEDHRLLNTTEPREGLVIDMSLDEVLT